MSFNKMRESGQAAVVVLILSVAVAGAVTAFYSANQSTSTTAMAMLRQKKAFYNGENVRSLAVTLAQQYFSSTTLPTSLGLTNYLTAKLPPLMPTGYSIPANGVTATIVSQQGAVPIPNGPFAGMSAPQATVQFSYTVVSNQTGAQENKSQTNVEMTLAQLGMFQFMYFIDLNYADFTPGPPTTINGRVHVNGDFCFDSEGGGLTFAKVTASGRVMQAADSRCLYRDNQNVPLDAGVATGGDMLTKVALTTTNDNGCTNCALSGVRTGLAWPTYALQTWNGNLQDEAMGVSPLYLPLPANAMTQLGSNGDSPSVGMTNSNNLRFLIDPDLPIDPPAVQKMKFADQADIRIIDGVWYLNVPGYRWPGFPIWSDHPGSFTDPWTNHVGQDDLRTQFGAAWWNPHEYSYYNYDRTNQTLYLSSPTALQTYGKGILSYGALFRRPPAPGVFPTWEPENWMSNGNFDRGSTALRACDSICSSLGTGGLSLGGETIGPDSADVANEGFNFSNQLQNPDGSAFNCSQGYYSALDPYLNSDTTWPQCRTIPYQYMNPTQCYHNCVGSEDPNCAADCAGKVQPLSMATALLNATRGGIQDQNNEIPWAYGYPRGAGAMVIPANFDLAQFQAALSNTTPGELGSYFQANGLMGRAFNGIIFLSFNWPSCPTGTWVGDYCAGTMSTMTPTTASMQGFSPLDAPVYSPRPLLSTPTQTGEIFNTTDWYYGVTSTGQESHFFQANALPYQMCSQTAATPSLVGAPFDAAYGTSPNQIARFTVPDCANLTANNLSFPNSVRVFNGATLNPNSFPNGLSIVTNIPMLVLGSMNTNSVVTSQTATPWMKFMVAADQIMFFSDNWDDSNAPADPNGDSWSAPPSAYSLNNPSTTYNLSFITGFARSNGSVAAQSNPALMEDWTSEGLTFNGSIVLGYYPVYKRQPRFWDNGIIYKAGTRSINYDPHLNSIANHPTGAPLFYLNEVVNWKTQ